MIQDSVVSAAPVAPAVSQIHQMLATALPNVWVMAGLTVGLLILSIYMARVPHDYPFRGAVVAFSSLGFLACAVVTGIKVWEGMRVKVPNVQGAIQAVEEHEAAKAPVGALDTYVPSMPGADSTYRREQPSVGGLPGGTIWDETTSESIPAVIRYYADDANHPGWQVELSSATMIVLRHTITSPTGQLENERMRIQAMANPNRQSNQHTQIEYELTRRLK